jgi:competence protein ComEC
VNPGPRPDPAPTAGGAPRSPWGDIPWAYPAALGSVAGCGLTTAPQPLLPLTPPALVALALLALGLTVSTLRALPLIMGRGAPLAASAGVVRCVLLVGCAFVAAALRGYGWVQASHPFGDRMGQTVTVAGVSDGVRLRVSGGGSVVLRGEGIASGRVTVRGTLRPLAPRRNPGGFDEAGFWRRRDVHAALHVEAVLAHAPPTGMLAARDALREGVVAGLGERSAALQQAVTLGLRFELGELRALFAAAGMAHLLALSGLHVGVLAGAVSLLARPLGRRRGGGLVLLVVVGYVLLVGPGPSVVRAASMVAAVVAARALGVRAPPLPATLALAAMLCLLVAPAWVGDLGFALSFLSVLGIALLAGPALRWAQEPGARGLPARVRRRRRAGRMLVAALATSAAAQAATASLVAGGFGSLPLLAPLANVLAVPLASALVPLGALAGIAGVVHPSLARLPNALTGPLAEALLALAALAARGPALPWGEIGPAGHLLALCALGALALAVHRFVRWRSALLVISCAACVSLVLPDRHGIPELIVLDVGQGDAVVLRLGAGAAVLVDGGGVIFGGADIGERVVVRALRAMGVWRLPLVVATHADLDHMGGLRSVIEAFPVGELWIGHPDPERAVWQALERVARRRGIGIREVRRGESAVLGELRLDVLHPTAERLGESNADGVALLVRYRGAPWALLLGDVPAAVEADLPVPPTPVLLAPHHGSSTSTSAALLVAARPELALVSAGVNRYGHPSPVVLERLARASVPVLATVDHGALRVPPGGACARTEISRPGASRPGTC